MVKVSDGLSDKAKSRLKADLRFETGVILNTRGTTQITEKILSPYRSLTTSMHLRSKHGAPYTFSLQDSGSEGRGASSIYIGSHQPPTL